jgi:hypothetical protein
MRTIIDLPAEQLEALDALRRREGISRAEAIRRLVASYVGRPRLGAETAFGLWRHRRVDAVKYEMRLRREWDRPRERR